MNIEDRSQVHQALLSRRQAIADDWYKAIAQTSFASLSTAEVRQRFVQLTEQAIVLLLTQPFERSQAEAIGASLAGLHYVEPDALSRTQEVLGQQLVEGLPVEQVVALQPRLAALLGGVAAGFFQQARETIISEQERIRSALIGELQRAEEVLRESEKTARALLNAPTDSAVLTDPEGTIIAINETGARRLGKSEDELVGMCIFDFFPPDKAEFRKARVDEVIRLAEPIRFEDEHQGRVLDTCIYPVLSAQGKVERLAIYARDITERKRAEEELIRLSSAVKASVDSIVIMDVEGKVIDVNESALRMYGADDKGDLIGQRVLDLIAPEHREKALAGIEFVLEEGYDKSANYEVITKDGRRIPVELSAAVMKDADGKPIGIAGIARDITERKQAEQVLQEAHDELEKRVQERTKELAEANEALKAEITQRQQAEEAVRESEEKYRHVVERANDGICVIQDTIVKYANPRLAEMWGGTVEEVVGTPFTDYVHPDELPKVVDRYKRRVAGEDVRPIYETVLRRKDGSKVYAELNAGMITYQGNPADLVFVRDITERKQAEEEIKQRNRELSTLNAIAATVSQSLDLGEVLNEALTKVLEVMEMEVGAVRLLNDDGGTLDLKVHRGVDLGPEIVESISRLKLTETPLATAIATGEPLVIEDISTNPIVELIGRRDLKSLAVIPLRSRGRVLGTMEIVSPYPRQFTPEEMELLTSIGNQIGVAIQNAQLWCETKRRLQESTVLLEVSRALASVLKLDDLLQLIIDSALETIEIADSGVIHLLDDASGRLHPKAMAGKFSRVISKQTMSIGEGIAGLALEQGKAINVPDIDADPNFIKLGGTHEFKSLLAIPLVADGKRIGTISVKSREIGAFTADGERLLMTLASHAATAVNNAQLFARSEELAVVKERNRIACEIHDSLAQNLASLSMKIDYCLGLIDSDLQATKAVLSEAKAFVQENIQEIRRSIFALHPPALKELGFLAALRTYAQEFEEQNALPVHLSIEGEEVQSPLSLRYEYELFRIVQESLNNVRRHARAKNVWITLDLSALDTVSLTVMDDGLGFDGEEQKMVSPALVGGFGLENMRERAKALGGKLFVETEPGSGTKITAILPLGRGG